MILLYRHSYEEGFPEGWKARSFQFQVKLGSAIRQPFAKTELDASLKG